MAKTQFSLTDDPTKLGRPRGFRITVNEVYPAAGAGFVVVDQQHGAAGPAETMAMLQAIEGAGAAPLVRVPRNDPWLVGHPLDLGAAGVIVPLVESAEDAARAVAACRYAPVGRRSVGPVRGDAGPAPLCLVMIETRDGVERAEEIAATPGLDGIYVGPSDLALSFGLPPTRRLEHPQVLDGIERIRAACRERDLFCGLHCLVPEDAARFRDGGFALLTAGVDLLYLRDALTGAIAGARG
jgi:4-hydroxy-2-oxoheptanedioate aldolase